MSFHFYDIKHLMNSYRYYFLFRFVTMFLRRENIGLILGLRPANERRRYKVTPSLIGWARI